MTVEDLKSRLRIAALATGAGVAVLLLGSKVGWISQFDTNCAMAATSHENGEHLVHDINPDTRTLTVRTLKQEPASGLGFQSVHITDDPDRIFEHSPPSALDYAIILESLRNRGYHTVILTTRMSWDEQPGLEAKGLGSRLALFERAVIPVPVTRSATPQTPPAAMQRALIAFSQVRGNHWLIPTVNQVPLATHTDGGEHTLAGFDHIENVPASPGSTPLLAHWQGHGLIPSIDLLAVMAAHGTSPAELIVRCGKHIRLGVDGPVIPLDDYGQTATPELSTSSPAMIAMEAERLITPAKTDQPGSPPSLTNHIALIHATGEKTSATNSLPPTRLASLPILAQSFTAPENPIHIRRLPLWASLVLIIDLALLSCWFGEFSRTNRHFAYALTAIFLFPLLLALIELTGHWLGLAAPLATLLTTWIIPVPKPKQPRKQTEPIQHYDPAEPRPVIRA